MADDHQGNPFIDQLLHDLRLDQLPEPKRTQLLDKITELAERRVLQTIVMNMDEGTLGEFEQRLQSGMTEDQAAQLMIEKVPGLSAKVGSALRSLYQELIADIEQIDQKLAALPSANQQSVAQTSPLVMPAQDISLTPASEPPSANPASPQPPTASQT